MPRPERWDALAWEAATLDLLRRDGDRCWLCGLPLGGDAARHHRMPRRIGGDRLDNLVMLHSECHRYVHSHPDEAQALGLIVSIHLDVAEVPAYHARRSWRLLDFGGGATAVSDPPGNDARRAKDVVRYEDTPDTKEQP